MINADTKITAINITDTNLFLFTKILPFFDSNVEKVSRLVYLPKGYAINLRHNTISHL